MATLLASLGNRLNNAIFWSTSELRLYLRESLTCWQAYARFWRQAVGFNTHTDGAGNPQVFYDLTTEVPQLAYTFTDSGMLSLIEWHLLEPQSGIASNPTWSGTPMFPQAAYTDAMQKRRDRFKLDVGSGVQVYTTPSIAAGTPRFTFPSSLIDIRRVSWVDANGNKTVLWRDDEFAANAYDVSWAQTLSLPTPIAYSVAVTQPYTIQLLPPPGDIGNLEVLAIAQGAPLNPTVGVILGIPDNFAWAVKFGAMADLLSQDGPGADEQRAQYSEGRYAEGVALCREMPTVINGALNQVACEIDSVFNFDAFSVGWNNATSPVTPIQFIGMASRTMLAVSAVPDPANPTGVNIDCVVNCPLPPDDTTPINITADMAEVIIDEAEHLARWKEGGAEAMASIRLHKNLVDYAKQFREMSGARAPYWEAMTRQNRVELVGRRMWR